MVEKSPKLFHIDAKYLPYQCGVSSIPLRNPYQMESLPCQIEIGEFGNMLPNFHNL